MAMRRGPRRARPRTARRRRPACTAALLRLFRDYRFWAASPSITLVQLTSGDGEVQGVLIRPVFPKGVCRHCGCSQFDACVMPSEEGCAWADRSERCCTNPACVRAEARRRKAATR